MTRRDAPPSRAASSSRRAGPTGVAGEPRKRNDLSRLGRIVGCACLCVLLLTGCPGRSPHHDRRIELIHEAVTCRQTNPRRAIGLLRTAGAGAALERFRLTLWDHLLRSIDAPPSEWRRYIAAGLPQDLDRRAKLALGTVLLHQGRRAEAAAVLEEASVEGSRQADGELLGAGGEAAARAARRMAVRDPARLHRLGRPLEAALLSRLTPAERLARAAAWRRLGQPARGAIELERLRWRGGLDRLRRDEIARCRLAAGSPRRALRILPPSGRETVTELLLRARCELRRAWKLFPKASSRVHFRRAGEEAARVAAFPPAAARQRLRALAIVLEASTEQGRLASAWSAWVRLRAAGWRSSRRSWLGRRLGVAMASSGLWKHQLLELERELPGQRRCLEFWAAAGRRQNRPVLERLASAPVSDLYARWALRRLQRSAPGGPIGAPAVGAEAPPSSVALLLRWGETDAARLQWRWLRSVQIPSPREALAAARLEMRGPDPTEAIRWLRAADSRLGTVRMNRCPADLVRAYLPLRWVSSIRSAARKTGLDPWLIAAVARQESSFAPHAVSPRGAVGLLQLTPRTARRHARALGLGPRPDLRDPDVNLLVGSRELAALIVQFGALEPALAAYNGGAIRTARWWKRWPDPERFTEAIPVPETYTYVRRVVYLSQAYRRIYAGLWRKHD